MDKYIISLGPVSRDDWLIQASLYKDTILVCMFNEQTFTYCMHYLRNEYEANLYIEYVLEKGEL